MLSLALIVSIVIALAFVMLAVPIAGSVTNSFQDNFQRSGTESSSVYENPDSLTASVTEPGFPASDANDDNVGTFWQADLYNITEQYADSTASTQLYVNQTRPVVAENVNASSTLINKKINEIELSVRKQGNPTGAADVGVFRIVPGPGGSNGTEFQDFTTATADSEGPPIMNFSLTGNTDLRNFYYGQQERGFETLSDSSSLLNGQLVTNVTAKIAKTDSTQSGVVLAAIVNASSSEQTPYYKTSAGPYAAALPSLPLSAYDTPPSYFQGVGAYDVTVCTSGCNYTNVQTAINSVPQPAGGTVRLQFTSAHVINTPQNVSSNTVVIFEGNARLQYSSGGNTASRYPLWINGEDNVKIVNANITSGGQNDVQAIRVEASTNIEINGGFMDLTKSTTAAGVEGREVSNFTVHGINVVDANEGIEIRKYSPQANDRTFTNVWVYNNTIRNIVVEGIIVNSGGDVVVRDNNVTLVTGGNLYDIGFNDNVVFLNNYANSGSDDCLENNDPCTSGTDISLSWAGVDTDRASLVYIVNNTFYNVWDDNIFMCGAHGATNLISHNRIYGIMHTGVGSIHLTPCAGTATTNTVVQYNAVHRPDRNAITVTSGVTNTTVTNNIASGMYKTPTILDNQAGAQTTSSNNIVVGDINDVYYIYPNAPSPREVVVRFDPQIHYDVHTGGATANCQTWEDFPICAEFVGSGSSLVGKTINQMEVTMCAASGETVGTITVGVWSSTGTLKWTAGTRSSSNVFTCPSFQTVNPSQIGQEYTFHNDAQDYTIVANDRIGISYSAGTTSASYIALWDNTSNPFDGTNAYRERWNGASWTSSTGTDIRTIISYRDRTITSGQFDTVYTSLRYDGNATMHINGGNNTATISTTEGVTDTAVLNNPTEDTSIRTNSETGSDCSTQTATIKDATLTTSRVHVPPSDQLISCKWVIIEWPLTTIPNDATIDAVRFKSDIQSVASARNCDYMPMTNQPSITSDAQTLKIDVYDGTAYLSNDATCTTAGDNKSVTLGASAVSEVQSRLTNGDWFAVGIKTNDSTREVTVGHETTFAMEEDGTATPKPTLEVDYTTGSGNGTIEASLFIHDQAEALNWKNVEITVYLKAPIQNATATEQLSIGTRTNAHNSQPYPDPDSCNERGYFTNIGLDGMINFQKGIVDDPDGYSVEKPSPQYDLINGLPNEWKGFKMIVLNEGDTNNHPHIQIWHDIGISNAPDSESGGEANGGYWVKLMDYYDVGGWTNPSLPDVAFVCGYDNDEKFLDAAITSLFRITDIQVDTVQLKNLSVREIQPKPSVEHIFWQKELTDISTSPGQVGSATLIDGNYTMAVGDQVALLYAGSNSTRPLKVYTVDGTEANLPESYQFDGGHTLSDYGDTNDDHYAFTLYTIERPATNMIDDNTNTYWENKDIQGTNEKVYGDYGTAKKVTKVRFYKPSTTLIPSTINVYVTNNTGALGAPVASSVSVTAAIGFQTIDTTNKTGRYVVLEVNTWGSAKSFRIAEFQGEVELTGSGGDQIFLFKEFGTISIGDLTTSFQNINRALNGSETYTMQAEDFIGIRYNKTGLTSADYIEVQIDTNAADPFDGTASKLATGSSGSVWTYFDSQDITGTFYLDSGAYDVYIYADMNTVKPLTKFKIHKPDSTTIPATIEVYASNDAVSWGTPILDNYALAQSTGFEEIDIPNVSNRYLRLDVDNQGTATSIKLAEYDLEVTTTIVTEGNASDEAVDAYESANWVMWTLISFAAFGVFFGVMRLFEGLGYETL